MGFGLPAFGYDIGGGFGDGKAGGERISRWRLMTCRGWRSMLCGWSRHRALLTEMALAALTTYADHPTWEESAEIVRQFLLDMVG